MGKYKYETTQCFIDGKWRSTQGTAPLFNPYNQEKIADVAQVNEIQVQQSITSAQRALGQWKKTNTYERAKLLQSIAEKMSEKRDLLAEIICLESGKKIVDAISEVDQSIENFLWNAEEIKRINSEIIPSHSNTTQLVVQEPIGVVGLITPWNFPLNLVTRKLAPALAAGCTIVLKPSSMTPLISTELVKIIAELPFPDGCVNLVTGSSSMISSEFMKSPIVRKISFTGSTKIGKKLFEDSATTLKKLSLELGGNAPFIIFSDANLSKAVKLLVSAKKRNMGQVCTSPNRIFIQKDVKDLFLELLKEEISGLNIGNPMKKDTEVGPLISIQSNNRINKLVEDAVSKGAIMYRDIPKDNVIPDSIYPMTILYEVNSTMDIYFEEIFGPVFSVITFDTDEEVLGKANETEYGLASYVFTENLERIKKFAIDLEFGLVAINEVVVSTNETPFGGIKYSGFGRENGIYGIREYLEYKFINIGGGSSCL
ncbi:hypothetical protein AOC36_08280 [Erysipelothrix larvae]|uniref:Aldehyde dehydrogenase domain-containing protein n=1 Tax=Erysipelothrix larvae TaxID=1514105 RepID=A0A0X8H0U8_9FIRM|nr:NAD-dependent succinate-semialdehyde dehydrogenase [Erysipelothrix larvae]AMC93982.1 hypothetical protein AOC36_08280 [Erysipelothrix larvae]